jgi:hypothetical protein
MQPDMSTFKQIQNQCTLIYVGWEICHWERWERWERASARVSSETSFVSKQPKLEPKLGSALFETRCLFRLFRFDIETGSFGVSKQPKQTKDQPKQQQIC